MSNIAVVERVVDRILNQDLESALDLIASDVELTVLLPKSISTCPELLRGREAVRDYFGVLGAIVTFWRVRFVAEKDEVLVLGKECYVTDSGMECDNDFMLACEVREGLITRILVIEDLTREAPLRPTVLREADDLEEALV